MKQNTTISNQIRQIVTERTKNGVTLYRIGQDAKVDEATLRRFLGGNRVSSETIDKLAAYFSLTLTGKRAGRRKQ